VESAIARVLDAEAAAAVAVEAAEAQARNTIEETRARCRRITERAGERLLRLTQRIEAAAAQEVDGLNRPLSNSGNRDLDDSEQLARIVEAIAADLTGASR
jgi:vacuolar-type H+-ATPase subunit H